MKEFYDTELLENARADLYFNQFGDEQPLPQGKGNKVEWSAGNLRESPDAVDRGRDAGRQ